jgi:hypothetical protein
MKAIGGCFQFFYASKEEDLPHADIPTRDVIDRLKTEPHLERHMENWCKCRARNVRANVRKARKLHEQGGQHYMILTTRCPKTKEPFAVGILEFSFESYTAAVHEFPRRWCEKAFLPYVGSRRSKIVSWRDAFSLKQWMKEHGKKHLPGARYGVVATRIGLLRKILKHFHGKKDQTDEFLENVHELECRLKKKNKDRWADYWARKMRSGHKCTSHKNAC